MTVSSFYGSAVPVVVDTGPDSPIELAVKFKSSVDGWVTHIRFYKSIANTGDHYVSYWSDTDGKITDQLAVSEAASGWIDVQLTTAIPVVAGVIQYAGYHAETGHYSADAHYFDVDVTSGQLLGLSSSVFGGNGVYDYGSFGILPTQSFNATSYGVDVMFTDVDPTSSTIIADLNVTEGTDTLVSIALVTVGAALSVTESPDALSSDAGVGIAANLEVTESPDTLASHVSDTNSIVVDLNVTESADTLVSSVRVTTPSATKTLAEIIPAVLNSLVDNRVWQMATPDNLPRGTDGLFLPFVLWHRVGGQDQEYIDQTMGSHRHARIQIQSCAPSGITADTLHEAVCQALLASAYTVGVLGSPVGTYDADRKLHAPWQQFSIWFQP